MLGRERAWQMAEKMRATIQIQHNIQCADLKKAPGIDVFKDEKQFYDPNAHAIHIGAFGPVEYFGVKTEEEYVNGLMYLYGHENQHVRSTASVPYKNGIMIGAHSVVEYIAAECGDKRKRFRNETDYEDYCRIDLPAKGIRVSYNAICSLASNVMNAIEDGRIERIRSQQFPGFETQRRYFRALVWQNCDLTYKEEKDLTAEDRFRLLFAQVLSLATSQLYTKGFAMKYAGTGLMDEVKSLMPYIGRGVLAGRTREMAMNGAELCKKLAPYIYELAKGQTDAEMRSQMDALAEILKDLIKDALNKLANETDLSEADEETDDGLPSSAFPQCDLEVTLDDETYDKLMEKMKNKPQSNGDGMNVMVKREHPKEEEEKEAGKNEASGSGQQGDRQDGEGSEGSEEGEKKQNGGSDLSEENDNFSTDDGDETGSGSGEGDGSEDKSNALSEAFGEGEEKEGDEGEGKGDSPEEKTKEEEGTDGFKKKNGDQGSTSRSGKGTNASEEDILKEMLKAAREMNADAKDTITNINELGEHEQRTSPFKSSKTQAQAKPVTSESMKDICEFIELQRKYTVDTDLPPVLKARCKAARKKNERYFRSLSSPNVTHLDSGSIDPSLIYGLAFGETEIFRKKGIDRLFDGCCYLLIDNSGSMHGNKRTEACKAAAVIEESFKGLMPLKIVAFDQGMKVIHEVVKDWDEAYPKNCCWNFCVHGRNGGGNDDGHDIMIATRELLSRKEEKKLLIVLSDGAPANTGLVKQAVDGARKKGISVFSIYFEEGRIGSDADQFREMYTKDYVCCALSEVDQNLSKLLYRFSRS